MPRAATTSDPFNAIAEPRRRDILVLLAGGERPVVRDPGEAVDRDINGTFERVAKALAAVEEPARRGEWYERFLWALQRGAIPAGRITSNAGAEYHKPATSTINCTVSGTISDSMHDILDKVHEAGLTLKAGCGIGYEFSTLRPRSHRRRASRHSPASHSSPSLARIRWAPGSSPNPPSLPFTGRRPTRSRKCVVSARPTST